MTAPIVNHRSIRSRRARRGVIRLWQSASSPRDLPPRPGNFRRSLFTGLDWRDLGSSSSSARGVRSGSQIDLGAREAKATAAAEASPFIARRCTSSATKVIFLDRYRLARRLSARRDGSLKKCIPEKSMCYREKCYVHAICEIALSEWCMVFRVTLQVRTEYRVGLTSYWNGSNNKRKMPLKRITLFPNYIKNLEKYNSICCKS